MDIVSVLLDLFLHLDKHLATVVHQYGILTYFILFLIIFLETGLVITPFLPGDSLLFAAGAISAGSDLQIGWIFIILAIAAIAGDSTNYWIGQILGPRVFHQRIPFMKKEYLTKTEKFYEKHGGKTIILARFIPIIRTFAPFVAGVGRMHYTRFLSYNILGGVLWVALFVFGGYFFGNLPIIKKNFHYVIVIIVLISVLPPIIEYLRNRKSIPSFPETT